MAVLMHCELWCVFSINSFTSFGGKLLQENVMWLFVKWKPAMNTWQCNAPWLNFWLPKKSLQMKFTTICRLFSMITIAIWVLCIIGKKCKDGDLRELICMIKYKGDDLWWKPTGFTWARLIDWWRSIGRSLKGKLLLSLEFHRNV